MDKTKKGNPAAEAWAGFQRVFGAASGATVALIALIIICWALVPHFGEQANLFNTLSATAVVGVLAAGATFVIITGGIELSIGPMMIFASIIAAFSLNYWTAGWNPAAALFVAIIAAMLAGGLVGAVNGFVIARLRVPAFIATLGMQMILKGVNLIITGTKPVYFVDFKLFTEIANGSLVGSVFPAFPLPNSILVYLVFAVLASMILNKTKLGLYTFALGSNEEAARLSGINTVGWKIAVHTLCGLFCGVAGILMGARINSAQPAMGPGYELDAFAAIVIGGTSMSGGEGSVLGSVIGALLMNVLLNALRLMGWQQQVQWVCTGVIIIAAVYIDFLRSKKV